MQKLTIREADHNDIPAIHELVAELARYEKAESEFTCGTARYLELYNEKLWNAIVACHGHAIIGLCIYYFGFSTWKGKFLYLEDFIVSSTHRRKGIGRSLFDHLSRIAVENHCELMRWQVLDWNQPAINFYKKYKAHLDPEWIMGKFEIEDLERLTKNITSKE